MKFSEMELKVQRPREGSLRQARPMDYEEYENSDRVSDSPDTANSDPYRKTPANKPRAASGSGNEPQGNDNICMHCSRIFKNLQVLSRHMNTSHSDGLMKNQKRKVGKRNITLGQDGQLSKKRRKEIHASSEQVPHPSARPGRVATSNTASFELCNSNDELLGENTEMYDLSRRQKVEMPATVHAGLVQEQSTANRQPEQGRPELAPPRGFGALA